MLDHSVAPFDRLAALDALPVAIDGTRQQVALAVGEGLEELRRE